MKFCLILQFLTFVVFVADISNKHFCKVDKILSNFYSLQSFVLETVYKLFGFESGHFKQLGCDILERYCISVYIVCVCK